MAQGPMFLVPALQAPGAWHWEEVPGLLCTSFCPLPTLQGPPQRSGNSSFCSPGRYTQARCVPEGREGVFWLGPVDRVRTHLFQGPAAWQVWARDSHTHPNKPQRWPGTAGTHGRVQTSPGALRNAKQSLLTRRREREDPGESSRLGNCSARKIKDSTTRQSQLCKPCSSHSSALMRSGRHCGRQGGEGLGGGKPRLRALPPWGPSCPTQTRREGFQGAKSNRNSRAAFWAHSNGAGGSAPQDETRTGHTRPHLRAVLTGPSIMP